MRQYLQQSPSEGIALPCPRLDSAFPSRPQCEITVNRGSLKYSSIHAEKPNRIEERLSAGEVLRIEPTTSSIFFEEARLWLGGKTGGSSKINQRSMLHDTTSCRPGKVKG
jgi:hypothetical protein